MENQINPRGLNTSNHPFWLLLCISLPVLLLLLIFGSLYGRINTLFDPEESNMWLMIGISLLAYLITASSYALTSWINKKSVLPVLGLLAIAFNLALLLWTAFNFDDIIPLDVPLWMYMGDNYVMYVIALLMPGLLYGMSLVLLWLTPRDKKQSLPLNIILTVGIPLFWLLVIKVLIPLFRRLFLKDVEYYYSRVGEMLQISLLAVSAVIFIFFLIRVFILIARKHPLFFKKHLKIPFVLIFPILGLLLNNMAFGIDIFDDYIFGNFSHPLFYIVAAITGILLILPSFKNESLNRIIFYGRVLTLPYTLYFFLVFLPFLPLSIPVIIVFGAGLLMLSPLILLIFHTRALMEDIKAHPQWLKPVSQWVVVGILFMVIPLGVVIKDIGDRVTLYRALDNIYRPDYTKDKTPFVSPKKIETILKHTVINKRREWFQNTGNTPLLTPLYNRIVFGYQTLSRSKIDLLDSIYQDAPNYYSPVNTAIQSPKSTLDIVKIDKQSRYNKKEGVWTSTLKLWVKNKSQRRQEYSTLIELPQGTRISDFHLKIGDKLKQGLLSDKKTAMWVYNEITRPRTLDPGILYYLDEDTVQLKVFPFAGGETRYMEIEITHLDDVVLTVGRKKIRLGEAGRQLPHQVLKGMVYLDKHSLQKLDIVKRPLEYYFVVDKSQYSYNAEMDNIPILTASFSNTIPERDYSADIETFIQKHEIAQSEMHIIALNFQATELDLKGDWQQELRSLKNQGGFYAGQIIRKILVNNYQQSSPHTAVIILVSDSPEQAIFTHDLGDYAELIPDIPGYYTLQGTDNLRVHPWENQKLSLRVSGIQQAAVFAWPDKSKPVVFMSTKPEGGRYVLMPQRIPEINTRQLNASITETNKRLNLDMTRFIEFKNKVRPDQRGKWIDYLIKFSFANKMMNTFTSYIVLENEAQEKGLLEKQKRVLSGKHELDAGEDQQQMTEPSLIIMILLGGVFIAFYLKREKKAKVKAAI